jgi:hypothetical protein
MSMTMKPIGWILSSVVALAAATITSSAQTTNPTSRRWLAFDDQVEPGTPGSVRVVRSDREGTSLGVHIPGVWLVTEPYAGRTFTRVELPEPHLDGLGFPQKQGERGWYDFPEDSGYPPLDPDRYRNALSISIAKALFPEKALGQNPQSAAEMERLGIDPAGARPGIPTLRGFLAVSRESKPEDLTLEVLPEARRQLKLEAPIMPAGFEGSDQVRPDPNETFGYTPPQLVDEEFYKSFKGEFTGSETPFSDVSRAGVFAAAELRVPLVQVLEPSTIEVFSTLLVHIKHLRGAEDFDCPFSWDHWIFKMPFINGPALREALTTKGLRIEASRSARYLILTPRDYRDELNTLALWKQSKGLNVDFAYVGNAATDDVTADRTAIDRFLEDYFQKHYCHGVYVLLVGDTDVIPTGRSTRVVAGPDGNDGDSDHVYEVLGSDRFPSLYVGRLSVNSAQELTDQLTKILAYERSPVAGDWPLHATLAANSENDDGSNGVSASHPSKYAAAVNAIATYGSYANPPTFLRLHAGAANNATPRAVNQDVTDAIDDGTGHVLYRGHGNGSSWVGGWDGSSNYGDSWNSSDVSGLNNRAFPIVYSIACQNGRIRNNDSIAELWMSRANAGAVAHWGASVNSYTTENHERSKGIFRALYQSGFTRLAPALAEAERISHVATGGGSSWDNNTFCYLLLGDPELTVRKRRIFGIPNLTLVISNLTAGNLLVRVLDVQGAPQPGAFVNLTLADGRRLNGFANADGQVTFPTLKPDDLAQVDAQADGFLPATVNPKPTEPPVGRRWLAFDDQVEPGTPGSVRVVRSDREGTSLGVHIPGVWLVTEPYAGRTFTRVELPEPHLDGLGFPQKQGERGWYDFPEDSGYPPLDPDRYRNALSISIAKALFPEKALGQNPQSAAEMERLGIDPAGARPGIPTLRGFLAVSRESKPEDLTLEVLPEARRQLKLEAPIMPAGFEGSDQVRPDPNETFGYTPPQLVDEEFYKSFKGEFTGSETPFSDVSRAGVFAAAELRVPLVQVLEPSTIEVFSTLLVHIKHLRGAEDFDCPFSWDHWIFKMPFINGPALREALTTKGLRIEASRSARYLILTPRDYRDELNTLALWKQSKGLNVDFAYVGNAATDDVTADRTAIDRFLEDYFQKHYCHGVYVLLVGDTDVIPTGRSTRVVAGPDGNDGDSDHVYEVLGSDRFPSLYVGRLSVNSAQELTDQLTKILAYERSPVAGDWPLHATLAANSENDDGSNGVSASHPSKYAAAVNAIATYGSYANPPTFLRLHAGAANNATPRAVNQDVTDAIDDGTGHVLYRGHGNGSSWVGGWDGSSNYGDSWNSSDVSGLNNRAFPIVYSIACQNGRIRNNDSIAELWMSRANAGAVAHWGASVNSYTTENHERSKGIFRALYQSGFTRLAPALAEAERISHVATGGGSSWDNNTFCYLLLGDPELTVRRKAVSRISFVGFITNLVSGARLQLLASRTEPLSAALVNVTLADGRSINGFSREDGSFVVPGVSTKDIMSLSIHADGFASEQMSLSSQRPLIDPRPEFSLRDGFRLKVRGAARNYAVQASTDLREWRTVRTFDGEEFEFVDPDAVRESRTFYRVIPID